MGIPVQFAGADIARLKTALAYQKAFSFIANGIPSTAATISNINISAGSTSGNLSAVTFSNSNGVSFGLNAGVITATVATNYQSTGNYLTTAMASNRGSDFVQANATFHGTNASGTIASDGISVSVAPSAAASINISAGASSSNVSAVTFSNANNVSFGYDGTNITASATVASTQASVVFQAGVSSGSFSGITFSNSNSISFGLNNGTITASFLNPGILITMGGSSLLDSQFFFYDTNGVSWAMNPIASAISASVRTNYAGTATSLLTTSGTDLKVTLNTTGLTVAYPAWITTYVNDLTSGRAGTNTSVATTSGTDLTLGVNTSGVTIGYPKWLTTAAATDITSGRAGTNTSVATTSGTDLTLGVNTSGVTIGYPKWITTYVNDLTSARAGTNTSVQTTSGTDLSCALNTSGLTIAYPAWITTYVNDLTSQRAGTNTSVATTSGTDLSCALNTSGLTIAYPKWITTYVNDLTSQRCGTNTSVATTTGTDLSFAANTSGITIAYPKWLTAAPGAGTGFTSTSTAGALITAALGTNGLSMAVPNYLTTAAATNDSSNNLGLNTSVATTAGTDLAMTGNSSGLTIGYPKWITTAAQTSAMASYFENMPMLDAGSTTLSASGSVLQVVPFVLPYAISAGFLRVPVSMSYVSTEVSGTTANSTWTVNRSYTDAAAIMVQKGGASSLSLQYLTSSQATWVFQNQIGAGANGSRYTVTQNVTYPVSGTTSNYTTSYPQSSANVQLSSASLTLFTGLRWLDIPLGFSLSAGNYWLALGRSTNSATQAGNAALGGASAGFSYVGVSQNNVTICFPGAVTNSSCQLQPGLGSWSTNAAVMSSSSLQLASISAMSSGAKPYFQIIRYA